MNTPDIFARWFANAVEIERLTYAWQRLETKLMETDPDYDPDTSTRAEAVHMREIDGARATLMDEQETVLAAIVAMPTEDHATALAKLRVALSEVWVDEHPEIHRLLTDALMVLAT
jgi:uncharacterized protein (DUF2235 family)